MKRTLLACLLMLAVGGTVSAEDFLFSADPVADGFSVIYDPESGALTASSPDGTSFTALEFLSATNMFLGGGCNGLDGPFDVCNSTKVFLLNTAGTQSHNFGNILPTDLTPEQLAMDLSMDGASTGGGFETGTGVYIVHPAIGIPEPVGISLFGLGMVLLGARFRK